MEQCEANSYFWESPKISPIRKHPKRFINKVAQGKEVLVLFDNNSPIPNLETEPTAPPKATNINSLYKLFAYLF